VEALWRVVFDGGPRHAYVSPPERVRCHDGAVKNGVAGLTPVVSVVDPGRKGLVGEGRRRKLPGRALDDEAQHRTRKSHSIGSAQHHAWKTCTRPVRAAQRWSHRKRVQL